MILYKSFSIQDEKAINDFLSENSYGIPVSGIRFLDNKVIFMYGSSDLIQQIRENMTNSINDLIGKRRAEIIGLESDCRYWRELAKKGVKSAASNVVETMDRRDNNILNLKIAEDLRQEIMDGKWDTINIADLTNSAPKVEESK